VRFNKAGDAILYIGSLLRGEVTEVVERPEVLMGDAEAALLNSVKLPPEPGFDHNRVSARSADSGHAAASNPGRRDAAEYILL